MDMNQYKYIGDIEIDATLEGESPAISVPAGISPKKNNFLLKGTMDVASSVQLVGGVDASFSDMAVNLESAVALGAGNVTPATGMIQTERDFSWYKLVGTVAAPPPPAVGKIEVYYGAFE